MLIQLSSIYVCACLYWFVSGVALKKKKIWNRVDCQRSAKEKNPKTHKRLKERFLIGRNTTKFAKFRGSPRFQATYNIKNRRRRKKKKAYYFSFFCLLLRQFDVGGWRLQPIIIMHWKQQNIKPRSLLQFVFKYQYDLYSDYRALHVNLV